MEAYPRVVATAEQCIIQLGGVVHSLWGDRLVGVWSSAEKRNGNCEMAATAALLMATKLTSLRRSIKGFKEMMSICISVTSGCCRFGVFGSDKNKVVQFFGEPLLRSIRFARVNRFHDTTTLCDDVVREAVERVYPCKPIEILENGDIVYEVINQPQRKETDLEAKLSVYKKAFELYRKKYYREALKAFRAFTKQYGYDSSVERIQTLISG